MIKILAKSLGFYLTAILISGALWGCFGSAGVDSTITQSSPRPFPSPPNLNPNPTPPGGGTLTVGGPTVSGEQPAGFISGNVTVSATASGKPIASVQFFVDGLLYGVDPTDPYSVEFDSNAHTATTVKFRASATATDSQVLFTDEIQFTIDNDAPIITNVDLQSGDLNDPPATLSGVSQFTIEASDAAGVARVDFYIGTTLIGSDSAAPYQITYDTNQIQNGPAFFSADVIDQTAEGNTADTGDISISISNGGADITISSPSDSQRISGTVSVAATANDPSGVTSLDFAQPTGLVDTLPAADQFQANLDTTTLPEGKFTMIAQAMNGLNQLSFKTVIPVVDNTPIDARQFINPTAATGTNIATQVAMVGDVNDDGFDDLALGSPRADVTTIDDGRVSVYLGPTFATNIVIANPTPEFNARFGWSVTGIGDVNGDDYDDIAVGAIGAKVNNLANSGKAYIFYGPNFQTSTQIISPTPQGGELFGFAISGSGDVNGDNNQDIIVTAPRYTGSGPLDAFIGRAFVVYGPSYNTFATINAPDLDFDNRFGETVAMLGNTNGDAYDDFVVGNPALDGAPGLSLQNSGRVFVFRGGPTGPSLFARINDNTPAAQALFGSSVAAAGDVNGDNRIDLVIGSAGANNDAGKAYYVLAPNFSSLSSLTNPSASAGQKFGSASCGAGDVDGDGNVDLAVSAPVANKVVIYKGPGFTNTIIRNSTAPAESFGAGLSCGGDVNKDTLSDILVSTPGKAPRGGAYILYNSF